METLREYLKLKVPPGLQFIIGVVLIWWIKKEVSNQLILTEYNIWIAALLLALAGIFGVWGLIAFYRHSTSVNPHKPQHTSSLVTSGVYRVSRNPMYLALLFGLFAAVFYWGNIYSALVPLLFIWYMNEFQIKPEEEVLAEKFGSDWEEYSNEVRRWI